MAENGGLNNCLFNESKKMPRSSSPLQDNIRLLGDILGETILACEGRAFLQKIETLRHLAKKSHMSKKEHDRTQVEIASILMHTDSAGQYKIAKAFTAFMQLVNVAEQTHRIRRRRQYRANGHAPQKSSPDDILTRLLKSGVKPGKIKQALSGMNIELVITAHPTEVMLPETIHAYRNLSSNLLALDNTALAPEEREQLNDNIRAIILRQWKARVIRDKPPTPQDEARYGIELTEKILWEAVPLFFRELRASYRREIGDMAEVSPCPIRFASWMGGDRDGHPGVTAQVTREVLQMSMAAAKRLYAHEITTLTKKLSFLPEDRSKVQFQKRLHNHLEQLGHIVEAGVSRESFMQRLEALKAFLQEHDLLPIVEKELQNLIWRLRVFGFSLLKLDIRQSSAVHKRAVAAFIPGYEALDEEKKVAHLLTAIAKSRISQPKILPKETREVLATMALLHQYPAELFGDYIISMAAEASDILAVQLLLKAAGVKRKIPISPLFETPETLASAAGVMARLYAIPAYRRYVGQQQEIMLGYSDSGKRGGYMRSLWDIYLLQEDLTREGLRHGIETVFFHGRGGALARGGGPIESVMAMMPRPQKLLRMRMTEQGEIINAKFGMPGIAGRTMERYLAGMMEARFEKQAPIPPLWRQTMEQLAKTSAGAFRETVYDDPDFMKHFEELTPVRELHLLKIGSRPGSRKKGHDLESMRAIPWVFSWTQPRIMLPAWKGVARALQEEIAQGREQILRDMYRAWPFFTAIIDMIEMSTALADPAVTEYYSRLLVEKDLQPKTDLYMDELNAARHLLLRIKGQTELLAQNPVLRRGIEVRTPYVDVLNILQANLLKKYRAGGRQHPDIKNTLALTFSGISAGMHNTG
jgi:phosphoenolpyruvate carboxylase